MASGLEINNGDFILQNKKLVTIEGKNKAQRDLYKFLVTEKEHPENKTRFWRYNPNYGTELNRLSNYKNLDRTTIIDVINKKLRESLNWYVSLQQSRANLSLAEIITSFDFVVFNHPYNPTSVVISISGKLVSEETISLGNFSQQVQ